MVEQQPVWFSDKAAQPVVDLMRWFVLRLNELPLDQRKRSIVRRLDSKNFPCLFDYTAPDEIDFIETIISQLAEPPYNLWSIRQQHNTRSNIRTLVLRVEVEPLLRDWLNMPLIDPLENSWLLAVDQLSSESALDKNFLRRWGYPGVFPSEVLLQSLDALRKFLLAGPSEPLSWRRLGAGFFEGHSKYLDENHRQQWLLALFPELKNIIVSRPVLLNVHLVDGADSILIVENQDTFCWLSGSDHLFAQRCHVVFGKGFAAGAQRIRKQEGVRFSYSGQFSLIKDFESIWFDIGPKRPFYFWGDLDCAGLLILKNLRQSFEELRAWQAGYEPMAKAIECGGGHLAESADKSGQQFAGLTGCLYADQRLVPVIQHYQRFLDQEWIYDAAQLHFDMRNI